MGASSRPRFARSARPSPRASARSPALAIVCGIAVLREGSEVVLFLYGIVASGTSGSDLLVGGLLGVLGGGAFTGLTYLGLLAIPTRYIFSVTGVLITFLAAGMAAQAVFYLDSAGVLTVLNEQVWDTSWLLSQSSLVGADAAHAPRLHRPADRDAAHRLSRRRSSA